MAQIDKPNEYFNTVLYTGNGSTQSISGVNFKPDWVWMKNRSVSGSHQLLDIVRGASKTIYSNRDIAEETLGDGLTSFDSDGFTISSSPEINGSGNNIVSWNWLAGGTGVSNTSGSITSTVSASTTSGFSIVSYTGTGANATVGHGLGVAPKMVIVKETSGADAWIVGHSSIGFTKNLLLNATNAEYADSTIWNNTAPTSSVFSVGSSASTNQSSATYISYCFAEKKGFSKFGSYTGNNNANGPFVYLGFRPAWVLVKDSGSTQHWHLIDSVREPFNDDNASQLSPNSSDSESSVTTNRGTAKIDFLSNGFKINSDGSLLNGAGSFIYMAFAESPLVGTNNIPAVAR